VEKFDSRTFEKVKVQRKLKPMTHSPDFDVGVDFRRRNMKCLSSA